MANVQAANKQATAPSAAPETTKELLSLISVSVLPQLPSTLTLGMSTLLRCWSLSDGDARRRCSERGRRGKAGEEAQRGRIPLEKRDLG